jgi:hypothetical protein
MSDGIALGLGWLEYVAGLVVLAVFWLRARR